MRPRVLVTKHIYPEAIERLRSECELEYHDSDASLAPEELRRRLADKHGVICQLTDRMDPQTLAAGPEPRAVSNVAVGYDNIDVPAASARKIWVTNTPGVLTETTADLAFGLLLAAARRIPGSERYLRAGHFKQWRVDLLCGYDVHGATLGIYGLGRIGQAVARRAKGFAMRVLYTDAIRAPETVERDLGVRFVSMDELLAESDFVSLHAPLTPETRHAIGAAELKKMKPTAVLVNTARGLLIDEAALAEALESGVIAGAGLDVFEEEPKVNPKLLELENAVLAPHIGSASVATRTRMCLMAAEDCLAALSGRRPVHPVNADQLDAHTAPA